MAKERGVKGKQLRQVSSPGSVYRSRASKPAGAASVVHADAGATYTSAEQALINEIKAKLNALIAALLL